jgi:hypothetical protein
MIGERLDGQPVATGRPRSGRLSQVNVSWQTGMNRQNRRRLYVGDLAAIIFGQLDSMEGAA